MRGCLHLVEIAYTLGRSISFMDLARQRAVNLALQVAGLCAGPCSLLMFRIYIYIYIYTHMYTCEDAINLHGTPRVLHVANNRLGSEKSRQCPDDEGRSLEEMYRQSTQLCKMLEHENVSY